MPGICMGNPLLQEEGARRDRLCPAAGAHTDLADSASCKFGSQEIAFFGTTRDSTQLLRVYAQEAHCTPHTPVDPTRPPT